MITKNKHIKLKSSKAEINKLERFIDQVCDEYNIYNSYYSNILVAVTEAFENAIQYGSKMDENKEVVISFENQAKGLMFSVKDQGEGFDPELVTDPILAKTEEEAQAGRGLFLMKHLSDKLYFEDNATKACMLFNISSINRELSENRANKLLAYLKKEAFQNQQN